MFDVRRREFITLLGGASAAWPLTARAQPSEHVKRIGILFGGFSDTDPEPPARVAAFTRNLQELGWTDGRNVQIELRIGAGNAEHVKAYAEELIGRMPDVLAANSGPAVRRWHGRPKRYPSYSRVCSTRSGPASSQAWRSLAAISPDSPLSSRRLRASGWSC